MNEQRRWQIKGRGKRGIRDKYESEDYDLTGYDAVLSGIQEVPAYSDERMLVEAS